MTFVHAPAFLLESKGLLPEIPGMLRMWVKAFQNCGSIMVPDTGFITKKQRQKVIILLAGGDKHTQAKDIKIALRLAQNL